MREQVVAKTDVEERPDTAGTIESAVALEGPATVPSIDTPIVLVPEVDPLEAKLAQDVPFDEQVETDHPLKVVVSHQAKTGANDSVSAALLDPEDADRLRVRWNEIQGKFVDEPRTAVQNADALISDVIEKITEMFASEHSALGGQWQKGNDVSTEDLRKALQRYRSFFNRLID